MNKDQLHPNIRKVEPFLKAAIELLYPYAEGVIHDLENGNIAALYNNMSKRNIGDKSALTGMGTDTSNFPDYFEPYYKTNWDGKRLKCTSVTIRDDDGTPIGLMCINIDTSTFENINLQLDKFLNLANKESLSPAEKFGHGLKQDINDFINNFTIQNNISANSLSKEQKSQLVRQMYDHGLFNYRDGATQIAKQLNISRTTVYNYLKESELK